MKKISFGLATIIVFSAVLCALSACKGCGGNNACSSYKIECNLDGNVLYATEEVDFYNAFDNSFSALKFNLFGNAFRKGAKYHAVPDNHKTQSYYCGENYGSLVINSVSGEEGALEYRICGEDDNILEVQLDTEVFPDERYSVKIDFTLNIVKAVARTGINPDTINLGNFYPILCAYDGGGFYECVYYPWGDPFYSDCADYTVQITADEKYTVASTGKKTAESVNDGKKTAVYKADDVRSFAFVLSEKFSVKKAEYGGKEVLYYYYDDLTPNDSLSCAVKALQCFTDKYGAYPYPTYSVAQTRFVQGGMEYPALVFIGDGLDERAYKEVIVHETAHQWWLATVGNNEVEYGFLDEGLAEYSVVVFYENNPEYGYAREDLIASAENNFKVFCSVHDKLFGKVDTSMNRSLKEFDGEYEYVTVAYVKPCIMYDCLRKTIGDEKFFGALKNYYRLYAFKNAVPDDLIGAFEKTGADAEGFLRSFIDGKEIM